MCFLVRVWALEFTGDLRDTFLASVATLAAIRGARMLPKTKGRDSDRQGVRDERSSPKKSPDPGAAAGTLNFRNFDLEILKFHQDPPSFRSVLPFEWDCYLTFFISKTPAGWLSSA